MMLYESVTVEDELKTKLWLVPKAGSLGQVMFIGLQSVHVCAKIGVANRAPAPRMRDWYRIVSVFVVETVFLVSFPQINKI